MGVQHDLAKVQFSDPPQEDVKDRHHDLPEGAHFLVQSKDFYDLF